MTRPRQVLEAHDRGWVASGRRTARSRKPKARSGRRSGYPSGGVAGTLCGNVVLRLPKARHSLASQDTKFIFLTVAPYESCWERSRHPESRGRAADAGPERRRAGPQRGAPSRFVAAAGRTVTGDSKATRRGSLRTVLRPCRGAPETGAPPGPAPPRRLGAPGRRRGRARRGGDARVTGV